MTLIFSQEHLSEEDDVDEVIWDDSDISSDEVFTSHLAPFSYLKMQEGSNIDRLERSMAISYEIYKNERRKRDRISELYSY